MSRSGYSDDCENLGLWRGAVERAIRGKRGQAFLREMANALDAMPEKELISGEIVRQTSASSEARVCAIGAVAQARKLDVSKLDIEDGDDVGQAFGIAQALAREIVFENDEASPCGETPAARWTRMRAWVTKNLRDWRED